MIGCKDPHRDEKIKRTRSLFSFPPLDSSCAIDTLFLVFLSLHELRNLCSNSCFERIVVLLFLLHDLLLHRVAGTLRQKHRVQHTHNPSHVSGGSPLLSQNIRTNFTSLLINTWMVDGWCKLNDGWLEGVLAGESQHHRVNSCGVAALLVLTNHKFHDPLKIVVADLGKKSIFAVGLCLQIFPLFVQTFRHCCCWLLICKSKK